MLAALQSMSASEKFTIGLQIIGYAASVIYILWRAGRYFDKKFALLSEQQTEDRHAVELKLIEISTTVHPYATDIARLKNDVQENRLAIAELQRVREDVDRHERRLETLLHMHRSE